MSGAELVALLAFLLPLAYSPGPGNAFFATIGARSGLTGAVPALVSYHLAGWVLTAMVGLGLGLTLLTDPTAMKVLGVCGASYVAWLGIQAVRHAGSAAHGEGSARHGTGWWAGMLVMALNAKAYLIIALLFTQFPPGDLSRTLLITTIFIANNLLAFVLWTVAGDRLAAWARRRRGAQRRVDLAFGGCLALVGAWLLVTSL